MRIPAFALRNRVTVSVAVAMLCAWGVMSFSSSPRRETPEFTIRVCVVTTLWPGATVEKVEQLVADPLEEAVASIDEVDRIDTDVRPGQAVIRVTIDDQTPADAIANLWDEVRAEVAKVALPTAEGCRDPIVNSNFGDTAVWLLAVHQDSAAAAVHRYDARQLEVFAEMVRDDLKLVDGVADAQLWGVQRETIYLESDPRSWSKLGLTVDGLAARLAQRNIVTSGGTMHLAEGQVTLKPTGDYSTVDQIRDLVTGYDANGNPIRLRDVGIHVRRAFEEPSPMRARYTSLDSDDGADGVAAVVIAVTMKSGHNVVELGERLTVATERSRLTRLPADVRTRLVIDTPTKVRDTIDTFVVNLGQSIGLVLLVAVLLIGVRIAVIMAAAIPVVMLGTFALMRLFDVELEQISIAALIIALGMLVDNAIEVADNVHRLLGEGMPRRKAALEGARQIGFPILVATLTTIAGFAPMLIALEGAGKEYVYSLPVVVSIALSLSWVLAMSLTTVMSYWLLRHGGGRAPLPWLADRIQALWHRVLRRPAATATAEGSSLYGRICQLAIRGKVVTIGLAVAAFAGALWLLASGRIGTQFFPSAVQSKFVVEVYLPEGTTHAATDEKCREVEALLAELGGARAAEDGSGADNAILDVLSFIGSGGPRYELGFNPADPASNYAALLVHVHREADVAPLVEEMRRVANARVAGARIRAIEFAMGPSVSNPVGIRIVGPGFADLQTMRAIAEQAQTIFDSSDRLWDVSQSWGEYGLELRIDVDEARATPAGVSSADVARSLSAYYSGRLLTTFREGNHQVPVYFRWRPEERRDLDAVRTDPIEGIAGKIPLDAVAKTSLEHVPVKLTRRDNNRMIEVSGRPTPGHLANSVFLADVWPGLQGLAETLPPGYRIEIAGEQEESAKAQANMATSFQITLALLLLLLVIQYNSLAKPLLILITIPLATTGAFVGLWLFGAPMGFMEMLGLLALVGIVLNAAIVYVEFAEMVVAERRDKGDAPGRFAGLSRPAFREALRRAGELRLLPISLTTLTTAGGLLPLALDGGPLFEGMATAITCGLLLGSVMTLLVLPALVALFVEWFGLRLAHTEEDAISAAGLGNQ